MSWDCEGLKKSERHVKNRMSSKAIVCVFVFKTEGERRLNAKSV